MFWKEIRKGERRNRKRQVQERYINAREGVRRVWRNIEITRRRGRTKEMKDNKERVHEGNELLESNRE